MRQWLKTPVTMPLWVPLAMLVLGTYYWAQVVFQ